MVAKPHLNDAGFDRAGVPLARAQRLKKQANANKSGRGPLIGVGVALLAGLAAFAALGPGTEPEATVTAAVEQPEAPVTAAVEQPVEPAEAPARAAAIATEPVLSPAATSVPRDTALPRCIAGIETQLNDVFAQRGDDHAWPVKQQGLSSLVQAGLNCELAMVEMIGSFDVAQSELGSVHVKWNRDTRALRIAVVDSNTRANYPPIMDENDRPIAFIVK